MSIMGSGLYGQGQWGTGGLDTVSRNDDIGSLRYEVERRGGVDRTTFMGRTARQLNAVPVGSEGLPSWYQPHHYRFGESRPELRPAI